MPTQAERLARIETLIDDPALGLIAHVRTVDGKVDDGLKAVNAKLDDGLASVNKKLDAILTERREERATRRPFVQAARLVAASFVGALAFSAVSAAHPFAQGPRGPQGAPGPAVVGSPGPPGVVGSPGPKGAAGANGAAGSRGSTGSSGPSGSSALPTPIPTIHIP